MGGVLGKRPRIAPATVDVDGGLPPAGSETANAKTDARIKKNSPRRGAGDSVRHDDGTRGRASNTVGGSNGSLGRTSTSVGGGDGRGGSVVGTEEGDGRGTDLGIDKPGTTDTLRDPISNQYVATPATSSPKDKLTTLSSTSDSLQNTPCRIKKIKGHGPLWKETNEYCNELLKEIESLSTSARLVKIPTFKVSKVDIIASYTADRLKLAQLKKESEGQEENLGKIPSTSLSRFCIKKNRKLPITTEIESFQFVASLDVKRHGFNLVIWRGSFALPTSCASKNVHMNKMNSILFDILMLIDDILESRQLAADFAELFWETRRMVEDEADRKAAVSQLRSTYRCIRLTILSLGGIPVNEPLEYWRETYPLVKF